MKYVLTVSGLAIMVVLLAACGAGPEPREILERSHDAMAEVQSYRISSEFESELPDGVMRGRQSVEWAAPDRWYMKVEFQDDLVERRGQAIEAMVIGDLVFNRVLDSGEGVWEEVGPPQEFHVALNPPPESYISVPGLESLRLEGEAVVGEIETFQITGERRETRSQPERFPPGPDGGEVETVSAFTWFISRDNYLLVRYSVEQDTGLGRFTHRTTMDFSDYNAPISIEAPDTAQ